MIWYNHNTSTMLFGSRIGPPHVPLMAKHPTKSCIRQNQISWTSRSGELEFLWWKRSQASWIRKPSKLVGWDIAVPEKDTAYMGWTSQFQSNGMSPLLCLHQNRISSIFYHAESTLITIMSQQTHTHIHRVESSQVEPSWEPSTQLSRVPTNASHQTCHLVIPGATHREPYTFPFSIHP